MFQKTNHRIVVTLLFSIAMTLSGFAQNIKGTLLDPQKKPIAFASVLLKDSITSEILAYTYTNEQGQFNIKRVVKNEGILSFSALGFKTENRSINQLALQEELTIFLKEDNFELNEVVVHAVNPIIRKKDTIVFNAASFLKGNEQVLEDLLKNIPGLQVAADGTIKIGNKEIEKVMVEGDDFFQKGYKILTKSMPPNPISKIEIIEKYSQNTLLKGIEDSDKIALNLKLKTEAKRIWFGTMDLGSSLAKEERYTLAGNVMNFGKKNKYYFLANKNTIGYDPTGDVSEFIRPYQKDEINGIGEDQKSESFLGLQEQIPNFKESRTNFNNTKLLSLNAIFNPNQQLKIKTLGFFNGDVKSFFRNSTAHYDLGNLQFTNTEAYNLKKQFTLAYGKFDLQYQLSKKQSLELITNYYQKEEDHLGNLIFNTVSTKEQVENTQTFFDQKLNYTHQISQGEAFLIKGRYLYETKPEHYVIDRFFYQEAFSNSTANKVLQQVDNTMNYMGLEGHYLRRTAKENLFQIQFGNQYREDALFSGLQFYTDQNLVESPKGYHNEQKYSVYDVYLKSNYMLKINRFSLKGKLELHQFVKTLNQQKSEPFVLNPKFGVSFKMNQNHKFEVSYAYNSSNAELSEIYDSYILTGFRSFFRGTGKHELLNASSLMFNYQLGNWGNKFFASSFILYSKMHDYFSSSSEVHPNFVKTTRALIKDKDVLTFSSQVDRYFSSIATNIKLNFGYSYIFYNNAVNSSSFRAISLKNFNYGFELRSGFSGFFNYHFGTSWKYSQVATTFKESFSNHNSFLDLFFAFNEKLNVEIQTEHYSFGQPNQEQANYFFADFSATYAFKKQGLRISLIGKNLFNTTEFKEFSISDVGSFTNGYRLFPRYVLLKVGYRF
uniref:carboxypeptidase-like regulatory domain-containing protein n=1 Tax=Polaribacter sp. TaxID=1920175 RepID=UPI0040488D3C